MVSSTLSSVFFDSFNNYLANFYQLYLTSKWTALASYMHNYNPALSTSNYYFTANSILVMFFNLTAWSLLFGMIVFYSLAYGAKLLSNFSNNSDLYQVSFNYFADLEEEMGAADDALFYFLTFGLIVVWFFFFTIFSAYLSGSISWIISLFVIVGATAVIVPTFVLKNFGLASVMYVRGSGRTTSLLFEAMLDFVSVAVIMIRFLIQNIRFVFIFSAFFELYEFIYDKFYYDSVLGLTTNITTSGSTSYLYWYEFVSHFILQWILYIYYLGHLTLLFIAQLSIYFALSFWLFFFLYTTFTLENHERYFLIKRLK